MEVYFALKTLHVIGAAVLLGTGAGIAFFMLMAHLSGDAAFVARTAGIVVLADAIFTATAALAQPLTGAALAHQLGCRCCPAGSAPRSRSIASWALYGCLSSRSRYGCAIWRARPSRAGRGSRRPITGCSVSGSCADRLHFRWCSPSSGSWSRSLDGQEASA